MSEGEALLGFSFTPANQFSQQENGSCGVCPEKTFVR